MASRDEQLMKAATAVWPFPNPPLRMGVQNGIVWATATASTVGINGYALVPAESHPWSKAWPETIMNQPEAAARAREDLQKVHELAAVVGYDEAIRQTFIENYEPHLHEDYLDRYLDVHSGISYYVHPWIGFSTSSLGDVWPDHLDPKGYCEQDRAQCRQGCCDNHRHWTAEAVAAEASRLAQQLSDHTELHNRRIEGIE